jgi:hypothetical protein
LDDRQRMQRLSEEVRARLEEMALILGRTVGMPITSEMVRKFVPAARAAQESPDVDIEIIDLPDGTSCCYDYINGVCACPC